MLDFNSIAETLINKMNQMYKDIILKYQNKNKTLVLENQLLKKQNKELQIKLNWLERKKIQNLIKVPQGSGYQSLFIRVKKQEFKLLNEIEQTQKVIGIQIETEKKQKILIQQTPQKNIIEDDIKINGFNIQNQNTVKQYENEQKLKISKQKQQQQQIQQINDKYSQNEKGQQQQKYLDHNNQLKNELPEEIQQKCYHLLIQIQEFINQNLQNGKISQELNQQLYQLQKTLSNSNDSTRIIEYIEESQKEQIKNGHTQYEQNIDQNDQQIQQFQKEELQYQLQEEIRKNNDKIKNQQMFLQELRKTSKKVMNLLIQSEQEDEDEDEDDQDIIIDESQFLKKWKKDLQQLAEEIVEYEENERNLKQQLEKFQLLKTKYEELEMYYSEAYNRLSTALTQIDNLNQEIQNKNQQIMQLEQEKQKQNNQFENSEDSLKKDQQTEDIQQQLLTQSQLINNQDLKENQQQLLLQNDQPQENIQQNQFNEEN